MSHQYILPVDQHNSLVAAAFGARGYTDDEADAAARFCELASRHGIRTHNAIKALHLDEHFGSRAGGCQPGAAIEKLPPRYPAVHRWNANRKLGQAVAFDAVHTAMELADQYGVGIVSVDNAFHYLWGGGYVIDAANRGYIAYTCCTAALAEVVPFGGRFPTLGTNPHSWAFPTEPIVGFAICIDWATSTVAMGRVQQHKRERTPLPPGAAVDAQGDPTTDPDQVNALLPFGAHKGYGLSLINELLAAYTGGSLPTLRSRRDRGPTAEKHTPHFFFQCIKPDALDCGDFACGRDRNANVAAVIDDILGHGNAPPEGRAILPGQIEAEAAQLSAKYGGLLFTRAEIDQFRPIAAEAGFAIDLDNLAVAEM
jgi:L-2-hydroxycarboxylate dehydrogenase (NAD+)